MLWLWKGKAVMGLNEPLLPILPRHLRGWQEAVPAPFTWAMSWHSKHLLLTCSSHSGRTWLAPPRPDQHEKSIRWPWHCLIGQEGPLSILPPVVGLLWNSSNLPLNLDVGLSHPYCTGNNANYLHCISLLQWGKNQTSWHFLICRASVMTPSTRSRS